MLVGDQTGLCAFSAVPGGLRTGHPPTQRPFRASFKYQIRGRRPSPTVPAVWRSILSPRGVSVVWYVSAPVTQQSEVAHRRNMLLQG